MLLHQQKKTPQTLLHTDAFTHTEVCTHRRFYTQMFISHTDTLTHRRMYRQTLLQTELLLAKLLHTGIFSNTQIQMLLYTDVFTHFTHKGS